MVVQSCSLFRRTLTHHSARVSVHILPDIHNKRKHFSSFTFLLGSSFNTHQTAAMSSQGGTEHWTAVRVRDTFLNYFKKNGHTFGGPSSI